MKDSVKIMKELSKLSIKLEINFKMDILKITTNNRQGRKLK